MLQNGLLLNMMKMSPRFASVPAHVRMPGCPASWWVSGLSVAAAFLVAATALPARADQVEMKNGDIYAGWVLSLNADTLVLQSDVLGKMQVPRSKIVLVRFGPVSEGTNVARLPGSVTNRLSGRRLMATNSDPDISEALRSLSTNTNLLQQAPMKLLDEAGPDARKKFNELMGGLVTGKISVDDIRAQARSAADQLRAMKQELGGEAGDSLDGYLSILDSFLKDDSGLKGSLTNSLAK